MIKNPNAFNDIENVMLQSYNRAVMAINIAEENPEEDLRQYLEQFSNTERVATMTMLLAIKKNPEDTKRQVLANVNIN